MSHTHNLYDSDMRFLIDPSTRSIKNQSKKTIIVRGDHNSERFTFEMPRMIEGHDMSTCDIVQIHYLNIDSSNTKYEGLYTVDDIQISSEDDQKVVFSWLISRNASRSVGALNFIVRFICTAADGTVDYVWSTTIHNEISVSETINNTETVVEKYADVIAEWEARIIALEQNGGGSGGSTDVDLTNYVTRDEMPEINVDDVVSKVPASSNVYPAYTADKWTDNYINGCFVVDDENYCYSPNITVKLNTSYSMTHKPYNVIDNNGVEISITESIDMESGGSTYVIYTPSNCSQISITIDKREFGDTTDINTAVENFNSVFMLVEGNTLPTEFESYVEGGYRLNDNVELPDNVNPEIEVSEIPDPPKDNGTYKLHSYRKDDKTIYYWKIEEYNREFFDYNASESGILSYNNMFYYDSLYKLTSQDRSFYKSLLFADNGAGTVSVFNPSNGELIKIYTHDKSELLKPHGNSVSIITMNNVPYMYSNIYNNYASQEDEHIGECCVYELFENITEGIVDIVYENGYLDSGNGKFYASTTRQTTQFLKVATLSMVKVNDVNFIISCYDNEQNYLGQLSTDLQSIIKGSGQWIAANTAVNTETLNGIDENIKYIRICVGADTTINPNVEFTWNRTAYDTLVQLLKIGFTDNADLWTITDGRPYGNFIADEENGFLYVYVTDYTTNSLKFHKFNLPSVTEGAYDSTYGCNVRTLEETEIVESWSIPYARYIQGGCYKDNRLWITHGGGDETNGGAKILVIDLTTKTSIATIDLFAIGITDEPEFIDFYNGECYYASLTETYKITFV